jgi:hypothetical protein
MKNRTAKFQYQALKKELGKLSGKSGFFYFRRALLLLFCLYHLPPAGAASRMSSLEARLADSVSAREVSRLQQEHEERIKDLQAQADSTKELETELAKAKEEELMLR